MTHCLDDLASDFSVYHRVGDITVMPVRTFMRLAERIVTYGGATLAWVRAQRKAESSPGRVAARMPVATAAQIRSVLAPVAGLGAGGMWGDVTEVKAR